MVRRNEIEGLRAVAVFLVIFSHTGITGFDGGFIGVDIFFTISGYLITSILLSEYQSNYLKHAGYGYFSIRAFYFRRAKRILPLSLFVILATLIVSFFKFNGVKFSRIFQDSFYSLFFLANEHFIDKGTNYFERGFSVSPLQHFWSLAVEEQFYLIFPLLVLLTTKFHGIKFKKRHINWNERILYLTFLITIFGFLYSLRKTFSDPTLAYFSSSTRAWQLSIGAFLAIYHLQKKQLLNSNKKREIYQLVFSLILLLLSLELINSYVRYPGFLAIFPILFTLIILNSQSNNRYFNKILGNKLINYFGSRSYSLYLIHWPLLTLFNLNNNNVRIAIFYLSLFAISEFSFRFIETPFRSIETPASMYYKKSAILQIRSIARFITYYITKIRWFLLVSLILVFIFIVSQPNGSEISVEEGEVNSSFVTEDNAVPNLESNSKLNYSELLNSWKIQIRKGLSLKTIPKDLNPPFAKILEERGRQWSSCMDNSIESPCTFGDINSASKVFIIGDSLALALYPTIIESLKNFDYEIIGYNRHQCMIANVIPWVNGNPDQECFDYRRKVLDLVKVMKPDIVILSDYAGHEIADGNSLLTAGRDQIWADKLDESIRIISENARKFIYFGQAPGQAAITDCVGANGQIGPSCIGHPSGNLRIRTIQNLITKKYGGYFINTEDWLCASGACPPVIDNTPVFWDGGHLGNTFASKLAPLFRAYLEDKGILN